MSQHTRIVSIPSDILIYRQIKGNNKSVNTNDLTNKLAKYFAKMTVPTGKPVTGLQSAIEQ